MITIYRILTLFLYPFLILVIILRKKLKKEDDIRFKEKIFSSYFNVKKTEGTFLIWFHAASVGEVKSILPILDRLNDKNIEFLITTVTLSSSKILQEKIKNFKNIKHRFFPLDINFLIKKFIALWKPNAIFLVDSEIWPNLIIEANSKNIPLALLNARITSKTFKRWMTFPKTAKKIFQSFDLCLSSNLETKEYLEKLNVKNVLYSGNIKLFNEINTKTIQNDNKSFLTQNKFWVAASTHKEEEIVFIQTHLKIKRIHKGIVSIIAPRHLNRVKKIKSLCDKYNLSTEIVNENQLISKNTEIVIINAFGVLQKYFKYAKSVFIGKSLIKRLEKDAGQNPIDAAKLGCKIYHGPYVYNFQEIYKFLEKNDISKKINNFSELGDNLIKDLSTPLKNHDKKIELIDNLGEKTFTDTMKNINKFLFNEIN